MKLILATDRNWGIGKAGALLCHIPGDLKYFKKQTEGKVVVMGRKTLESLPGKKGLPNRENFVLTSDKEYEAENVRIVHSDEELRKSLEQYSDDDIMIIGGGKVYRDYLPSCDTCYITKIDKTFDADTFFVNLDDDPDFHIVWESPVQEENGICYRFLEYKRK